METSPSINSSIRSLLILLGGIGVSRGWWNAEGLETFVDYLIAWGGATVALASAGWGVWAKWPESDEAKVITKEVVTKKLSPTDSDEVLRQVLEPTEPT